MVEKKKKQPLLINQPAQAETPKKPLHYKFGQDTYHLYHNPKNPFLKRILAAESQPSSLSPKQLQRLFRHFPHNAAYALRNANSTAAYAKRKQPLQPHQPPLDSPSFVEPKQLIENQQKLAPSMQTFFDFILQRLSDEPKQLPLVVNELAFLFQEHGITIKLYQAYRQFQSWEQFLETLNNIRKDSTLEHFEFFCSALFGFYSQLQ